MEGKWDEVKGNVEEGAGKATDDEELEAEGKKDQAVGEGKQAWEKAKDAVDDAKS
jgi:uncharacterized protein YjbJ (UPF0337 family)